MFEDAEIIRTGVFLYDDSVSCDLKIIRHNMRYGSGDAEDEPEIADDVEGEFYYIGYGSTVERGKFTGWSGAFSSIEEAVTAAEVATHGKVVWNPKE